MAFTSWAAELTRWKNALANRNTDAFFIMSTENQSEMRTVYTRLDNIEKFTEWLEHKAAMEAMAQEEGGYGEGSIFLSVGGE